MWQYLWKQVQMHPMTALLLKYWRSWRECWKVWPWQQWNVIGAHVQCISKTREFATCAILRQQIDLSFQQNRIGTPNQNGKEMSDLWTGGKLRATCIFLRAIVDCGIDCSTCCGVSCRRCIWSYWSDTGHRSHSSKPARTSSVSAGTECHGVRWKAKMIKVMKKDAGRLLGARWVRSFDQYLSIFGIEAIGQWLINEECCMK